MTQKGYEDYVYAVFDNISGTANSYITAIHIIDELFKSNDVFTLNGKSITCIDDTLLLSRIAEYIRTQQKLYQKGETSFFYNIKDSQTSYPGKGFCSAAISQLLKYQAYDIKEEKAWGIIKAEKRGAKISNDLVSLFDIDKKGDDKIVETKTRIGQGYFRKMVLSNYENKCCVTGLNVPQILRASHIVAWKLDKGNRMNPENGLCLSATYDAAFDEYLISFDDDYRMIVSKVIKDYYTNEVTKEYFEKFEGKRISLPVRFNPSKKLLAKHRESLVG